MDEGAVAQLGERLLCKQEVIGSIPFSSTSNVLEAGYQRTEDAENPQASDIVCLWFFGQAESSSVVL
jgi:hypothetical protein